MHTFSATDFVSSEPPQALAADEIHLWFFPQCHPATSGRIDFASHLRDLLAAYLQSEAHALRIERDTHGKPFLNDLPSGMALQFNLSHSADALLVGISQIQALGVDIENVRRKHPDQELAQRFFDPDEASALAALPEAMQARAFLQLWSCKEAVLKALGRGIVFGLDRLSFALGARGDVLGLVRIADEAGALAQWRIVQVVPQEGFLGALAWQGPALNVRCFRYGAG